MSGSRIFSSSKWRWLLADTDFGLGIGDKSPAFNMLTFTTKPNGPDWPNPAWSTFLLRNLLKNDTFKREFINRFTVFLGTTFRTERTKYILDSCENNILSEMYYNGNRWGVSVPTWQGKVNEVAYYLRLRPGYAYQHLQDFFGLGNLMSLNIHSSIK